MLLQRRRGDPPVLATAQFATVVPGEERTRNYQAESPDEEALVLAAKSLASSVSRELKLFVREVNAEGREEREYQILHVLEFTSARKRQSVIFRTRTEIILGCKGADNVIYERLAQREGRFGGKRKTTWTRMRRRGSGRCASTIGRSRTRSTPSSTEEWTEAKTALSDRDAKVEVVNDKIERELILVRATAIEDRLQDKVPACLEILANAELRIWIGDKLGPP